MKVYIDKQNTGSRTSQFRVRIIDDNFEKVIKYCKTEGDAVLIQNAIKKSIKAIRKYKNESN